MAGCLIDISAILTRNRVTATKIFRLFLGNSHALRSLRHELAGFGVVVFRQPVAARGIGGRPVFGIAVKSLLPETKGARGIAGTEVGFSEGAKSRKVLLILRHHQAQRSDGGVVTGIKKNQAIFVSRRGKMSFGPGSFDGVRHRAEAIPARVLRFEFVGDDLAGVIGGFPFPLQGSGAVLQVEEEGAFLRQ
jgi:hypothetical protein